MSSTINAKRALPGALLLMLGGLIHAVQGVAALATGGYFTAPPGYDFGFSIDAWGLVHLIIGALAIAVGIGVLRAVALARLLGLALAAASLLSNFLWLPMEPAWSAVLIALATLALWSLATAGPSLLAAQNDNPTESAH
jgi:hypothetical protein